MRTTPHDPVPFVLDPQNLPFVLGRKARPALRRGSHGCLVLFMLPFFATAVGITGFAAHEWWVALELARFGVPAQATVVKRSESHDEGTTYHLTYELAADGAVHTRREQVRESVYEAHPEGTTIEVRRSSRDASVSRIEGSAWLRWFLTLFAVVWDLFTVPITYLAARVFWRSIRLARDGVLVIGKIKTCTGKRDSDGDYHVTVEYEVATPRGWITAGSDSARRDDLATLALPAPGSPIAVLVSDERWHAAL